MSKVSDTSAVEPSLPTPHYRDGTPPASVPWGKLKSTACRRCHSRKVKCSGGDPCRNCQQAGKGPDCTYPRRERQVKVTHTYVAGLLDEIQRLKSQVGNNLPQSNAVIPDRPPSRIRSPSPRRPCVDDGDPSRNATLDVRPWFGSKNGSHTPILIGEAADAAFATRFRQAISDPHVPQPKHMMRVNYATDQELLSLAESEVAWPSPSRARFLVEASLRRVSRCYYIVRRSSVLESLEQSIHDPAWGNSALRWSDKEFPGMAYFAKASRMLGVLEESPGIDTIEILNLLSFYSLALNRRYSAFTLSGTAMRMAIVMGLHLNIPVSQLRDLEAREHRRRVFWTTYIFDRIWASKLGHPSAIHDDDIEVDLPSNLSVAETIASDFPDAAYYIANLRLASLVNKVSKTGATPSMLQPTTRPVLLHVLRIHVSSWASSAPSIQLLTDNWIDGSFATFDYFYTEYLFSALTVLAVSSLLDAKDSRSDKESFQEAARFLSQLKDAGSFAAQEYCRHVDAIKAALEAVYVKRRTAMETLRQTDEVGLAGLLPPLGQTIPTQTAAGGTALIEPSIQELLAQPVLDLQFLDGSVYDSYSQGLYWPDFSTEDWTPES
ncbi:hypothetical protein G7Z17_g449 [Cylindrodendrum hubeiense]|uniref:Zn(2)-C6 fungal-type domain-containing protein n=1 Tax=Cylindrodendrum hubeiense TaxID=595255 RepID=A0A9P5HNG8_9HYPO|nr:hypothetical protein G7Z17_g449 [Cylindrodendrum hubeiense]